MKDAYVQQRRTKGSVICHHSFSVNSIFNKNPSSSSSHITYHPPLHKPRLIPNQRSESCLQFLTIRFSHSSPFSLRRRCTKLRFLLCLALTVLRLTLLFTSFCLFFASLAADHQHSPTPPPTACDSQTTPPACLCLSTPSLSISFSLYTSSLSTQFTFSPPPPPHLVTMETPDQYRDKLTLANKE